MKIALTALQESVLRMYANSSVPESLGYDHDAVGGRQLNPFQQRAGWGSVEERMNLDYSIRAFFGGADGPNRGLTARTARRRRVEAMAPGVAAQTVQVSAYPDAYDKWEAAAEQLIQRPRRQDHPGCGAGTISGEMALPLDQPYQMTSGYGPRDIDVEGASTWHAAIDLQNWPNAAVPRLRHPSRTVTLNSALLALDQARRWIRRVPTSTCTSRSARRRRRPGGRRAADREGRERAPSGGCHLDLRINVADNTNAQVAQLTLSQNETRMAPATRPEHQNFVDSEQFMRLWGVEVCPDDWCKRL